MRKTADSSRSGFSPAVGEDSGEEEWEVEGILSHGGLDDGGLELLVRWKGGEETWDPYENVEEAEALDEYERLHGMLTIDTVDAP